MVWNLVVAVPRQTRPLSQPLSEYMTEENFKSSSCVLSNDNGIPNEYKSKKIMNPIECLARETRFESLSVHCNCTSENVDNDMSCSGRTGHWRAELNGVIVSSSKKTCEYKNVDYLNMYFCEIWGFYCVIAQALAVTSLIGSYKCKNNVRKVANVKPCGDLGVKGRAGYLSNDVKLKICVTGEYFGSDKSVNIVAAIDGEHFLRSRRGLASEIKDNDVLFYNASCCVGVFSLCKSRAGMKCGRISEVEYHTGWAQPSAVTNGLLECVWERERDCGDTFRTGFTAWTWSWAAGRRSSNRRTAGGTGRWTESVGGKSLKQLGPGSALGVWAELAAGYAVLYTNKPP